MNFPENIFKAYDIRGLVDSELSEELAYKLGRAFVVFLRNGKVNLSNRKLVVGRDMRASSLGFQKQVIQGILDEGVDVVDIGLASTPLFNFACAHYEDHAGGIIVTASHNPAEYNGFKITLENGLPVGKATGMDDIKNLVKQSDFENSEVKGKLEEKEVVNDYLNIILEKIPAKNIKPLKIVVDAGNGMAKVSMPKLLSSLSVEVEYLYLEPDGNFPNHEANPLKTETLKDLQKKVVEVGADLGFALDGDADRIGLVDENGEVVDASFVGGLVGLEVLKDKSKPHMLFDLRCSRSVPEIWDAYGATTEMCMVGHANIKKMMKETNALFASELSLHLYFGDLYDLESPDLSLMYILNAMSRENKKLSELVKVFNKYFHSGEINFEVEDKLFVLEKLKTKYSDAKISDLDGLLFEYEDFWFNVRLSNTEPVLRLNLEAHSKELMDSKLEEVKSVILS